MACCQANVQLSLSHLDHNETLNSMAFICETWTVLLRATSTAPRGFSFTDLSARQVYPSAGLLNGDTVEPLLTNSNTIEKPP